MRILRIRRGFTSNSSGANEFLPDGGVRPRVINDAGPPVPAAPATPVLNSVQPWGDAPSASAPSSNATTVGVVSVVVAGAFLVIPAIRLIQRKRKKETEPHDDDT